MIAAGEIFDIIVRRFQDTRTFKMNVECIAVSQQLLRFRITGGQKEMIMEKQLEKMKHPWKIVKTNFKIQGDEETIALAIMHIQDAIDQHLDKQ
jgi:hypothetical protein